MSSIEIELKARISRREYARIDRKLRERYEGTGERVDKSDVYYRFAGGGAGAAGAGAGGGGGGERMLRIRGSGSGGSGRYVVTVKERSIERGVEHNIEHEITLGAAELPAFTEMIRVLGGVVYCRKHKVGVAYRTEAGVLIELIEVAPLGLFVEIEQIVDESGYSSAAELAGARAGAGAAVREQLAALGVGAESIVEDRYIDLLLAAGAGATGGDAPPPPAAPEQPGKPIRH